jgi:hypothetical protein
MPNYSLKYRKGMKSRTGGRMKAVQYSTYFSSQVRRRVRDRLKRLTVKRPVETTVAF